MLATYCCMQGHLEEVDAVATRVDVAARQLDSLRQTSVLEDCFHIWYASFLQCGALLRKCVHVAGSPCLESEGGMLQTRVRLSLDAR